MIKVKSNIIKFTKDEPATIKKIAELTVKI